MRSNSVQASPKKRGLSLSNHKYQQKQKQQPPLITVQPQNQNWVIYPNSHHQSQFKQNTFPTNYQPPVQSHLYPQPQPQSHFQPQSHNTRFQSQPHHPTHPHSSLHSQPLIRPSQKPPVIIYRYKKSQWQQLQQANRTKRETIDKMKNQIQILNKEMQKKSLQKVQKIQEIQRTLSIIKPVTCFQSQMKKVGVHVRGFDGGREGQGLGNVGEKDGIQGIYRIKINSPQKKQKKVPSTNCLAQKQNNNQSKQKISKPQKHPQFQSKLMHQLQLQPQSQSQPQITKQSVKTLTKAVKEQPRKNYRNMKNSIDVLQLLQIQNRLEKLIDFTQF